MAVNEALSDYSTTAASNTPAGSDSVGPDLDNHLRDIKKNQAILARTHKGIAGNEIAGRLRVDDSATPSWKLQIRGVSAEINLFDIDASAGVANPYIGGNLPSTFVKDFIDEGTGSARNKIVVNPLLRAANAEGGTGSARDTIVGADLAARGAGTQGGIIFYNGSGAPKELTAGSAGTVLRSSGSGANPSWAANHVQATPIETTSGTSHSFTSLPSGIGQITVVLRGVSLNGTDELLLQIGDAGGLEETDYDGRVFRIGTGGSGESVPFSTGFQLTMSQAATDAIDVTVVLTLLDASTNTWGANINGCGTANGGFAGSGIKALSAVLDRVTLKATGSNTFDAGNLYLAYAR